MYGNVSQTHIKSMFNSKNVITMAQAWKVTVRSSWKKYVKGLTVQITTNTTSRPTRDQIFEAFDTQLGIKKESGAAPTFDIAKM